MPAQLRGILFLSTVVGKKLHSVVITLPIADLCLNSYGRRGIWGCKFHRHLITRFELCSGEHRHSAFAQGGPPSVNDCRFHRTLNDYSNGNIHLVARPAAAMSMILGAPGCCCILHELPRYATPILPNLVKVYCTRRSIDAVREAL